jgi:hypothetical protein
MPRYILNAGEVTIRTPAGELRQELWFGIEVEGPINLEYLSRHGYDLVPAAGLSEDELRSVGVDHFELLFVTAE